MDFGLVRVLRTPHSERFVLTRGEQEFAALELHYLLNGTVAGTLVVFEGSGVGESDIPGLLTKLDDVLLPDVAITEHNLFFTAVIGRVIGSFQPEGAAAGA